MGYWCCTKCSTVLLAHQGVLSIAIVDQHLQHDVALPSLVNIADFVDHCLQLGSGLGLVFGCRQMCVAGAFIFHSLEDRLELRCVVAIYRFDALIEVLKRCPIRFTQIFDGVLC